MSSPFPGSDPNAGFPPPPPGTPPPPPPGAAPGAIPGTAAGGQTPAGYPPQSPGTPPPGYQAYSPSSPANLMSRASFWQRFGGWMLDYLLYGLLAAVIAVPGIILAISAFDGCETIGNETFCPPGKPNGGSLAAGIILIIAAAILVGVLYIRALGKTGQTWGRKIAGVKVVDQMSGHPIGIGKAIGRTLFAYFISAQILYLGFLWMIWDKDKQTWHDKVVSSTVVKV